VAASDKAEIDSLVIKQVQDGTPLTQAFSNALVYKEQKDELVNEAKAPERPTSYYGEPDPKEVQKGLDGLYDYLKKLYDGGITQQKDLRKVAKGGSSNTNGWTSEEINRTLDRIYHKKPTGNTNTQSGERSKEKLTNILLGN